MAELGYALVDADNHYYEAEDAFTRHLDPKMARRAMQWAEVNGRRRLLVGGKINRFIPNPTFDPVAKPGCLDDFFRGRNPEARDVRTLFGDLEPIRAEYRDRAARLSRMDAQSMEACFLFPTLGVGMEQSLKHDPDALCAAFSAFNRWLDEDWGFAHQERLFAAPYITLVDPRKAEVELEWALSRDARLVCLRAGPVACHDGGRSPGDPRFDGFWARVNEAGITVTFHAGDSGYLKYMEDWGEASEFQSFAFSPFRNLSGADRPIFDTIGALVCHGVFARFKNVRVASIENGGDWVHWLKKNLKKAYGQMPSAFAEDPAETLRRHLYVAPYYEEDAAALAEAIGVDHVMLGSDFPHAEGLAEPLAYVEELSAFGADATRRILRDNALGLLRPSAGAAL